MTETQPILPDLNLQPGELYLARGPAILRTILGSCVGVTFRCARLGAGRIGWHQGFEINLTRPMSATGDKAQQIGGADRGGSDGAEGFNAVCPGDLVAWRSGCLRGVAVCAARSETTHHALAGGFDNRTTGSSALFNRG